MHDAARAFLGIDIGVTNVKWGCVTASGKIIAQDMFDTNATSADWPPRVKRFVSNLKPEGGQFAGVGIAAPGLAAPDGSAISWMQGRLEGVQGVNWSEFLDRPVSVLNDAQAALQGEAWLGAAKGSRNVMLLTLGTGVGGALMVDGRLLRGHIGRAGHLGHICLDVAGERDIVGTPGSLEDAIGNCTLARRSGGRFASTHDLIAAHLKGDAAATAIWLRSIRALACGIASLVNVVDPEIVVIGGGIARAEAALFDPLASELHKIEWRPHHTGVRIVPAVLGEYAGAFGAARNAMETEHE